MHRHSCIPRSYKFPSKLIIMKLIILVTKPWKFIVGEIRSADCFTTSSAPLTLENEIKMKFNEILAYFKNLILFLTTRIRFNKNVNNTKITFSNQIF